MSDPLSILVVEDVETDALLFIDALKRSGLSVSWRRVENAAETEREMLGAAWDCVVSDFSLPGFNAFDALRIVRTHDSEVPFILLTGSIGEEATAEVLRSGAQDCLFKDRPGRWVSVVLREIEAARQRVANARASEALREMEGYYHATFDSGPLAIMHVSPEGRILRSNHRFQMLLGYTERETVGLDLRTVLHPEDVFAALASMRTVIEGREDPHTYQKRYRRKDGSFVQVEVNSTLISDQLLRPLYVLAFVSDVTERRAGEAALRESETRYRTIVELAKDLIVRLDTEGRFRMVNQAAEHAAGWTRDELARVTFLDFVHPDDQRAAVETFGEVIATGEWRTTNLRTRTASGSWLDLEVAVSPDMREGEVAGVIVVARDIGERLRGEEDRARMKQRLELGDRLAALGRVSAGIAHEFNNVLMGIAPFAEVIGRKADTPELVQASSHIAASIARGRRITHEILRFTSPAPPVARDIDLVDWIASLRESLTAVMTPAVQLAIVEPSEPLVIHADREQMEQVLLNLVTNARDAIEGEGRVTITCAVASAERVGEIAGKEGASMVCVTVSDDGPGILEEYLPRLFEPFFTTKRQGTGLGLPIAFDLVRRNGGHLIVDTGVGRGTTIQVYLLGGPGRAGSSSATLGEGAWGEARPARVLLVEDDDAVGEGLVSLLKAEGIETEWVRDGASAMPAVEEREPDLVLLDVGLPDMHGSEVWAMIRGVSRYLPIIFSTGHGDEVSGDPSTTTLRKPWGMEDLRRAWATVRRRS